ncbi:MAG: RHS repeat domain-containing protein [Victivallaceae bacterium]|nr:RHS repeat-associated core domain-containing protein [Victivallaceae bacterium]
MSRPRRFAFSSEEWLGDYGPLRYLYHDYSPSLKRFLTRDPLEESGGVNLYNFVGNNPVTKWDALGQASDFGSTMAQGWKNDLKNGGVEIDQIASATYELIDGCDCFMKLTVFRAKFYGEKWLEDIGDAAVDVGSIAIDGLKYLWNAPNSIIGILAGTSGLPFSYYNSGDDKIPLIGTNGNAITFPNSPYMPLGAITLGNVQLFGKGCYRENILKHEARHTDEQWWLGPFYVPGHVIAMLGSLLASLVSDKAQWKNVITPDRILPDGRTNDWFHRNNILEF